jgi:hypothetical protein
MTSFVAEISSQVALGKGRTRIPSLIRSNATRPCSPRARIQSAGSWMQLPDSIGVRFMGFSGVCGAKPVALFDAAMAMSSSSARPGTQVQRRHWLPASIRPRRLGRGERFVKISKRYRQPNFNAAKTLHLGYWFQAGSPSCQARAKRYALF